MAEPTHILVVDDDAGIRRLLQLVFTEAGYRVLLASSGEEAISYLELVTPDLIIMDLMMAGMDGQQVTVRIKRDPRRAFIPIILMTAISDRRTKVSVLDSGADDYLTKPVDLSELLARVRVMLRLNTSQRQLRVEQHKTELLLGLTRDLNASLDLDELLSHFLQQLAQAVDAVRASIILVSNDQPRFFSSSQLTPTIPLDQILRNGVAGFALRARQPLLIRDTHQDERWHPTDATHQTVRSAATMPIERDGRPLGAITLVHHTPNHFVEEHLELLAAVAPQTAVAVDHADLYQLTQTQNIKLTKTLAENQALERREQDRIRGVFARYVAPELVDRVMAGGAGFGEPVEQPVAVIFADLRGYTALAEGLAASVLVEQVLNRYFTAMTAALYRHQGTVDKFMGDGIIGVFGTPLPQADDLARALAAAVEMQRAFVILRDLWRAELGREIGMGIGIAYGPAVVGNIGSPQRQDYTVIGDVVNTASRLAGVANAGQVVVSHHLVTALREVHNGGWPLASLSPVMLRGKQEPHAVFELLYVS
jgi:class 3 adenylate cyclase/DNA-binding response OmpR family regulator